MNKQLKFAFRQREGGIFSRRSHFVAVTKKVVLSALGIVALLMLSNPSTDKHRLAACEKFQKEIAAQKREKEFSPALVRDIVVNKMNLTVRNYYVYSCSYYPFLPSGHNDDMEQIECLGILGVMFDLSEVTRKSTIE